MPPKPKFTREEITDTAVDVIRESSLEAITAKAIGDRMGTSTRPMFTYFSSLEELREAALERAWEIYNSYAERGFSRTPAFKGFAMEYIQFAIDEPSLFRLLFMQKAENMTLRDFLNREGHLDLILTTISENFHIDQEEAAWIYENLWLFAHGIGTVCATGVVRFSNEEIAEKLGTLCRGLLMILHSPKDERTSIVPESGIEIPGTVESYMGSMEGIPPIPPYLS